MSLSENRMLNCESENEDDWGSDFEDSNNHPYSQEIEDNRINEIREANLLRDLSNNMNDLNTTSDDITQTVGMAAENSVAKEMKTGAIHKTGFYLSE
ncbi:hypothetical protein CEXT_578401 [Caerostris extrusa]|uniref:Uncharacterized protein n=1 Tax=Caerostris extrusa TaxID=172846 RepID=A0AAV4W6L6_CAEEX|nr:hypothetical protein CEXT_578401 [Caerostris extrusa]